MHIIEVTNEGVYLDGERQGDVISYAIADKISKTTKTIIKYGDKKEVKKNAITKTAK